MQTTIGPEEAGLKHGRQVEERAAPAEVELEAQVAPSSMERLLLTARGAVPSLSLILLGVLAGDYGDVTTACSGLCGHGR